MVIGNFLNLIIKNGINKKKIGNKREIIGEDIFKIL